MAGEEIVWLAGWEEGLQRELAVGAEEGERKFLCCRRIILLNKKGNTMTKGFFGSSITPASRLAEKKEARYRRHLVSPLENKNKTPEIRGKSPRKDPTRPLIPRRRVYPSWNSAPLLYVRPMGLQRLSLCVSQLLLLRFRSARAF